MCVCLPVPPMFARASYVCPCPLCCAGNIAEGQEQSHQQQQQQPFSVEQEGAQGADAARKKPPKKRVKKTSGP